MPCTLGGRSRAARATRVNMEVSLEPDWALIEDRTTGRARTLRSVPLSTPNP